VLGFPCNQFGAQAPCSSDCERAYLFHKLQLPVGTFPVFDKGDVNGPASLEPFVVAKNQAKGHDTGFDIAWNYEKFVVDADGKPVARFASDADPLEAEAVIRKLLGLPALEAA
jgi:glutathione peroxidase